MKVEQKKEFEPVVITLETKEELAAVTAALGIASHHVVEVEAKNMYNINVRDSDHYPIYKKLYHICKSENYF